SDQLDGSASVRIKSESCAGSSSKACREKQRRDRLNDKFTELSSILEPGRAPKTDKVAIISDAIRMVNQVRDEAQKLKDLNSSLQEKIKELKDEKQKLKVEKERIEQQLKAIKTSFDSMAQLVSDVIKEPGSRKSLYHPSDHSSMLIFSDASNSPDWSSTDVNSYASH
ncbi:transcription factor bHLH115, partial [Arabidopsis lyrata subsp. lyrata]|uniref:transcription factor bHLH115 n=1 Tax=Arabidopsis lyrata subsp. lyrata TaxID=81972 RepID=UPI000A29DCA4